jgi:2-polyprenyl-3-methyl-5-hydroxy-6-metoxy-1,4-benzoquinol methylase
MKSKGHLSGLRALGKRLIPAAWHPAARRIDHVFESWVNRIRRPDEYEKRKRSELEFFDPEKVYELPAISRYWSNKYLTPMLRPFGFTNALECFRPYLLDVCRANTSTTCRFLSIGAGSCDAEINIARWLTESGVRNFHFKCVDINGSSIEKALESAVVHGVQDHLSVSVEDLNAWMPTETYHAILAFQSLHHVLNLEKLFHDISKALRHDGYFMTDDMIGRNGHQRWPEALRLVQDLWKELPPKYKYNHQLRRFEEEFDNWDCSTSGFEGIRAQDILPLLIERFRFDVFIAFGNVIDVFIDRGFGHNFNPDNDWDREFIDRVHQIDVSHLEQGLIKPTHMLAVLKKHSDKAPVFHKHFSPEFCVRRV